MRRLLTGAACASILSAAALASERYADRLPPDTAVYVQFALGDRDPAPLDGTRLLELWNEPELQDFLEPAMSGIRDDLEYLLRESPSQVRERLKSGFPGDVMFAVPRFEWEDGADEPSDFEVVAAARFGNDGPAILDAIERLMDEEEEDDDDTETEVTSVTGRRAVIQRDGDTVARLVVDGDWLVLQVTSADDERFTDLFAAEPLDRSLAGEPDFRTVRETVGGSQPLVLTYLAAASWRELVRGGVEASAESAESEALSRIALEAPAMQAVRAIGYGVITDGELLRDRFFVHAPGDRSAWSSSGPIGDAPQRHAALADPDADLLATTWFDLQRALELQTIERERIAAILKEAGEEDLLDDQRDPFAMLADLLKDKLDLDVAGDLAPVLGHHASLFLSAPTAALAVPDAGVLIDLADAAAFTALLERVIERDDVVAEVSFSRLEFDDRELISVQLVNAGVPLVPTLCVRGDTLLVTTTPQAMKGLLRDLDAGRSLATESAAAQAFLSGTDPAFDLTVWTDMGALFEYLYGFVGLGLSALRMSGEDVGERFDASLLPTGEMLASYLGAGTMTSRDDESGVVFEGRSTLGNPLAGTLSGLVTVVGLIGFSEGTREAADAARTSDSKDHLRQLARTMEAYRGSFGGGSYPDSLITLVDRGLLRDASQLVDPRDPKPRRTRAGNGDRLPVSYLIGRVEVLPANVRSSLTEGAETILYTRDAWHERFGEKQRLAIVLGDSAERIYTVSEDEWGAR